MYLLKVGEPEVPKDFKFPDDLPKDPSAADKWQVEGAASWDVEARILASTLGDDVLLKDTGNTCIRNVMTASISQNLHTHIPTHTYTHTHTHTHTPHTHTHTHTHHIPAQARTHTNTQTQHDIKTYVYLHTTKHTTKHTLTQTLTHPHLEQ